MSTLPRVFLKDGNPLGVLAACKRVALKADWSLRQWVEFSESIRACFTAEALPEEQEQMMAVVMSHFSVVTPGGPKEDLNQEHAT